MANKLWGRKWKILVVMEDGTTALDLSDSDFEPGALRVTFRIEHLIMHAYPYAEIVIYNLAGNTEQELIDEGSRVVVEAGYQNGAYGVIFDGQVWQARRNRANVVDYTLTLNCFPAPYMIQHNLVKYTRYSGMDMRQQLDALSAEGNFELGEVTENLDQSRLPRGKTYFGEPRKYLRQIARHNNAQYRCDADGVHVTRLTDEVPPGEVVVLTPETGLVGTPQQIEWGVSFRCLLDPRIKVNRDRALVKLDMTLIRAMYAQPPSMGGGGSGGYSLSVLDRDGVYMIGAVTYLGDTRGNDWYVDAIGVSRDGKIPNLFQNDDRLDVY